jgi:hypothetical protein
MAIEWVGLFIYCAKAVLNSNHQCLDEIPVSDGTVIALLYVSNGLLEP